MSYLFISMSNILEDLVKTMRLKIFLSCSFSIVIYCFSPYPYGMSSSCHSMIDHYFRIADIFMYNKHIILSIQTTQNVSTQKWQTEKMFEASHFHYLCLLYHVIYPASGWLMLPDLYHLRLVLHFFPLGKLSRRFFYADLWIEFYPIVMSTVLNRESESQNIWSHLSVFFYWKENN